MAKMAFQQLDVYRLSEKLSDAVWDMVADWNTFTRDTIGKQIVRAADSIGANIAEGTGRGTAKDNCRFIQISRGSLYETVHFLRRAFRRRLLVESHTKRIQLLVEELGPRLNAYLTAVASRERVRVRRPARVSLKISSSNSK